MKPFIAWIILLGLIFLIISRPQTEFPALEEINCNTVTSNIDSVAISVKTDSCWVFMSLSDSLKIDTCVALAWRWGLITNNDTFEISKPRRDLDYAVDNLKEEMDSVKIDYQVFVKPVCKGKIFDCMIVSDTFNVIGCKQ